MTNRERWLTMRNVRRVFLGALFALSACSEASSVRAPAPAETVLTAAYVVAIETPIRVAATADAKVVRTLSIGTKVDIRSANDRWANVDGGYVATPDLAPDPVTANSLKKEFFSAPEDDPGLRLRWVRREAALSPDTVDVLERYVTTASKAGDAAQLATATERLKAVRPTSHVATGTAPPILVGTHNVLLDDAEEGLKLVVFGVSEKATGFVGEGGRANISFGKAPTTFLAVAGSSAKALESKRTPKRMSQARHFQLTSTIRELSGEGDSDHVVLSIGDHAIAFFGAGEHLYAVDLATDSAPVEIAPAPLSALKAVADIGADGEIEVVVESKGIVLYQLTAGRWHTVRRVL